MIKSKNPYEGFKSYEAKPTTSALMSKVSDSALIAWFRCNSCYTCKWREEVLDNDPNHDIHWCSRTHDRPNIIDMVNYLGYSRE